MQILRLLSVGSKFTKFLMSFFKAQVSSSTNFASFFSVMTCNSSVLFWLKHILSTKVTSKCKFSDLPLLALKFTKFLTSVLVPRVSFSSNFTSGISVMRHNSSILFHLKLYMLWKKGSHQVYIFRLSAARIKITKFFMSFFKPRASFLLNCASTFSVMTHNSYGIF